jgi:ATP-dependent exoDNAse (exonuclease V) alpha subunit
MNTITKLAVAALLGVMMLSTTASADVKKGQKIYLKKLKAACGFSGAKFAIKHTQDEWENIKQAGKFGAEVAAICPKAKLKPKYENDVYDFSYEYAKDSGNVPSC